MAASNSMKHGSQVVRRTILLNNYNHFNALPNISDQKALQDYHMPFEFDVSKVEKAGDTKILLQSGFITCFSIRRKTPIFTAQRLDGKTLKATVSNNSFFYSSISLVSRARLNQMEGPGKRL